MHSTKALGHHKSIINDDRRPQFWIVFSTRNSKYEICQSQSCHYQSCFISEILNTNNSKDEKWLMSMIPNINTCKCQSFWRSEMSSFNNVNVNCAQYQ